MPAPLPENKSRTNRPTLFFRLAFSLAVLVVVAPVFFRAWQIYRADRIVRAERSVTNYSQAIEREPSNALHWWNRGRIFHHSVQAADIPRAIEDYEEALSLNPRLGQAWLELADCYERQRDLRRAEKAIENALATRRYSPNTHWQAGNFYLRRGELARMYESFKQACAYDVEKLGIAIDIAWKADPDRAAILGKLIPDTLTANLRYLDFLVARDELDLARSVWLRSLKNEIPEDYKYKVSVAFSAIDHLIAKSRVAEAQQMWDEALQKSGSTLRETRPRPGRPERSTDPNLIWNGSFENEIVQGGFDWRFPELTEVQFQPDLKNRMEGLKSLKVTFTGSNISLSHLYQFIPIPAAGDYLLEFYARTGNITTDQTPYFSIQGYPNAAGASLRTSSFPAATDWIKLWFPFTVKENCRSVQLTLRRDQSAKFDNEIKGSLWIDGVSIRPGKASGATAPEAKPAARSLN